MLIRDPASVKYVRPEVSAFRAKHRYNAWSRLGFDFATLFLFTTEYEGSARSFGIQNKEERERERYTEERSRAVGYFEF